LLHLFPPTSELHFPMLIRAFVSSTSLQLPLISKILLWLSDRATEDTVVPLFKYFASGFAFESGRIRPPKATVRPRSS